MEERASKEQKEVEVEVVSGHMTALYILPYPTLIVLRCNLSGLLLKLVTVIYLVLSIQYCLRITARGIH